MMEAFQESFHGIQFEIPDDAYYETEDGSSWESILFTPMNGIRAV